METWSENKIIRSALDCDVEQLKKCLSKGYDINIQTEKGINLLMLTIYFGMSCKNKSKYIQCLIENGININHTNQFKQSAIHAASYINDVEIVKLLIQSEININAIDEKGYNALMYVCRDMRLYSSSLYRDWDIPNEIKYYRTQLLNREYSDLSNRKEFKQLQLETIKTLIDNNINIQQKSIDGKTALNLAVENYHIRSCDIVELLNDAGATCNNLKIMDRDFFDALFHGGAMAFVEALYMQHNYNKKVKCIRKKK